MIALIVAYDNNRVIGNKGIIPWKIKGEQKRFRELTTGNVVIMGRKTYEEIGKPLPNRQTIIISKSKIYQMDNCITCSSLKEAIEISSGKDIFISGGVSLYKEALDIVDVMYITKIDLECEGDTYFPHFDENDFEVIERMSFNGDVSYSYYTYKRKR